MAQGICIERVVFSFSAMPPKDTGFKKIPDKMTDAEKKKKQNENKAKANPTLAAAKKEKNDACRERRKESGSSKSFSRATSPRRSIAVGRSPCIRIWGLPAFF